MVEPGEGGKDGFPKRTWRVGQLEKGGTVSGVAKVTEGGDGP